MLFSFICVLFFYYFCMYHKYLNNININLPKINCKNIENFYNHIINLYEHIDYSKCIINHNLEIIKEPTQSKNKNVVKILRESNFLKILNYCSINNIFDKLCVNLNNEDSDFFYNLFETKNYHGILIFCNKNPIILKNINQVINDYNLNIKNSDLYNIFISLENLLKIENNTYKHILTINYADITINLNYYSKNKKIKKIFLKKIIVRIILICLYSKRKNVVINIDLYENNNKKVIPKYYKTLGCNEVNSALCISYDQYNVNNNKIIIYRNDEIFKVLIHELIHYLGCDLSHDFILNLNNHFNVSKNLKLNETYTELIALLFNSFLKSYESTKIKNINLLFRILNEELKFSLFQSAKIFNNYDYIKCNDFFKSYTRSSNNSSSNIIKQESSIIEYYILKTILLNNINNILELIYKYYDNNFLINNKSEFKNMFLQIIIDNININLINNINKLLKYISVYKKNNIFFNNLDMILYS